MWEIWFWLIPVSVGNSAAFPVELPGAEIRIFEQETACEAEKEKLISANSSDYIRYRCVAYYKYNQYKNTDGTRRESTCMESVGVCF